ncbi:MAG: DUF6457 domain-containing protein [Actinomycetota bacterium]|nr:DUF6457 domain-containing protein [Actinomycetota bacterium]
MTDTTGFFAELAQRGGTPPLDAEEADALLRLARVVAHRFERRYAPLACYVAGRALASDDASQRTARIRALTDTIGDMARDGPGSG